MRSLRTLISLILLPMSLAQPQLASARSPLLGADAAEHIHLFYGAAPTPWTNTYDGGDGRGLSVRRQGRDSNCDFIAVANGIQAIGGDGEAAYAQSRALIPQGPFDYREGYYTLLGPNGSDRPFTLDNLGAAPEAFLGVYEALGYDATLLAAPPDVVDLEFARTLRERLAAAPDTTFAHLWITPRDYNPRARILSLPATGERVALLYPYHEVAVLADPLDPNRLIVLDGLIGYPVTRSLQEIAYQLRGFNKLLIVQPSAATLEQHQRAQIAATTQPYAVVGLGGAYLSMARDTWGPSYGHWGRVIGPPLRMQSGAGVVVRLPGEYVLYERGPHGVGLAALGAWMRDGLAARGLLPPDHQRTEPLRNGLQHWVEREFGSVERFHAIYGPPLTGEFWLTPEAMRDSVLRRADHPLIQSGSGYVAVITERAMLVWSPEQGTTLVPLGLIFYDELRGNLGV